MASIPPIPPIPVPPPCDPEQASTIEPIRTATQDVASRHAADILETVHMESKLLEKEWEQNAVEREREHAELMAERQRINEECEARVQELEEELDHVHAKLDSERQLQSVMPRHCGISWLTLPLWCNRTMHVVRTTRLQTSAVGRKTTVDD